MRFGAGFIGFTVADENPFDRALAASIEWLRASKVNSVIVGGVAASLLGRPRLTRDIDVVADLDNIDRGAFVQSGERYGFYPRRDDCVEFAERSRVVLLTHRESAVDIDIMISGTPFEHEMIARSSRKRQGIRIPLPRPEDLIIMKAIAQRPKDLLDIEGVLAAHPRLNRRRILRVVGELAEALERPELIDNLKRLLARPRRRLNA